MTKHIRTYFNSLVQIPNTDWNEMEKRFELVKFKKGEVILNANKTCDFIGFLNEGIVRFYQLKEGNEKVTAFWFPGDFLSNYRSFTSGIPSQHYIDALTKGSFWQLKKSDLHELYDKFPAIDRLGRVMAERLYLMVSARLDKFLSETPEDRYRILQNKNSRLIQEIPQYMLASYIGVSPETLSRIRKRISS